MDKEQIVHDLTIFAINKEKNLFGDNMLDLNSDIATLVKEYFDLREAISSEYDKQYH